MVFTGISFLLYFLPIFFLVYFLLPDKFKNGWLALSSVLFYAWGAPLFIFAVILSCAADFFLCLKFRSANGKIFFVISVALNLLLLLYFKYVNFFADNFNFIAMSLTGHSLPWPKVILPIGISFLTFQKISFLTDVYRRDAEPQRNYLNYLLFVILFPHLIAGPIIRYKKISLQILNRFDEINSQNVFAGLIRFITGLSKKVLIANYLGDHANEIFTGSAGSLDFTRAWTGILAYTFQIYFDFSGYSDMAIGMARMMGFTIPENFNFPYTSKSITEFWKRWHITLGSWMKDYLYIPLGGNQISVSRTYLNLFVVFLLSGLWHGASWNFVIWGSYHGFFLVLERVGLQKILKRAGPAISNIYAFLVVVTGWVFFRISDFSSALSHLEKMYTKPGINIEYLLSLNPRLILIAIFACFLSFIPQTWQNGCNDFYSAKTRPLTLNLAIGLSLLIIFAFNLGELFTSGFNPFIYFKF